MPKTPKAPKPTTAELELLRLLWQLGPSPVKVVHSARLRERPDATYATVLRLMQVMHGKGLLTRDESERSHVYSAAQGQNATQANLLRDLIQKAFSGSGKALVLTALKAHVSDEERAEIKRFLKEKAGG